MQVYERAAATACLIRPAARYEVREIESIILAAYSQYRAQAPATIFEPYLDDLRRVVRDWENAELLVAELGGRIAGSVVFHGDASAEGLGLPRGWAGFRKLAVHPSLRGRGLGRALAEHCVERAREIGAPVVGIHSAAFMVAAWHLYRDLGFDRCPEHDLRASAILGVAPDAGDVAVIAFRRKLAGR